MAALSYKLALEERSDHLYACVESDELSFEMVIAYTNEIVQRLKQGGFRRLLLHTKTPVLESTDCYEIASYVFRNAIPWDVRIAVVDTDEGNLRQQQRITTASRGAGLDLRSFTSVEEAEMWLLKMENGKSAGAR